VPSGCDHRETSHPLDSNLQALREARMSSKARSPNSYWPNRLGTQTDREAIREHHQGSEFRGSSGGPSLFKHTELAANPAEINHRHVDPGLPSSVLQGVQDPFPTMVAAGDT